MLSHDQLIGSGYYEDMLHMPHHVSDTYPQMPLRQRAAQFAAFDALQGFRESVSETRRLTDEEWVPDPDLLEKLSQKLSYLAKISDQRPEISVTYFVPDRRKAGGEYVTVTGKLKRIDMPFRQIVLLAENDISDGMKIELDKVTELISEELAAVFDW